MQFRTLGKAFFGFREAVKRKRQRRFKCQKIIVRMQNKRLSGAFDGWHRTTMQRRRNRSILKRYSKIMRRRVCVAAFNAMKERWRAASRSRKRLDGALRRIRFSCLGRAFGGWRDRVMQLRRQKYVAQRAAAHMVKRSISMAWSSWMAFLQQRSHARAVLIKWKLRMTASSFRAWEKYTADKRRLAFEHDTRQLKMKLAIVEKQNKRILEKTIKQMRNAELHSAFRIWNTWLHNRKKLQMTVMKMQQRVLSQSFGTWIWFCEEKRRFRYLLKKWSMRGTAKCIATWKKWIDNRKYQKKVMSRFFLKMLRARLGAGFRSRYYTTIMSAYSCDRGEEIASLREKLLLLEESKAKLLEKASKIKNIKLERPFRTWASFTLIRRLTKDLQKDGNTALYRRASNHGTSLQNAVLQQSVRCCE